MEQLDMATKPTAAHRRIKVY